MYKYYKSFEVVFNATYLQVPVDLQVPFKGLFVGLLGRILTR